MSLTHNTPSAFVAIYGGSFDPPHYAHSEIIRTLCEDERYWHIIIMPTYANPLKAPPLFSPSERLEMCEVLCRQYNRAYPPKIPPAYSQEPCLPRVALSDYEIAQNRPVFTIESISALQEHFKSLYPCVQFAFVLGSDSFATLDKWHKPQALCEMLKFVLIERETPSNITLQCKPQVLDSINLCAYNTLSSTTIRLLLANGRIDEALEMIPKSIHTLIKRHFL